MKWCLLPGFVAAVASVLVLFISDYHEMCGKDHVKELCNQYEQNLIAGPLCHDLCQSKTLTFDTCLSTQPDKAIYKGTWKNEEVILKIRNGVEIESYSFSHLKTNEDHKNQISATVKILFGECENCSDLTDRLAKTADVNNDGQLTPAETMTMVTLLQTPEPSMMLIINDSKHVPEMYGYCGKLYAVEKLPVIADSVFGYTWNFLDLAVLPSILEPFEDSLKRNAEIIYKSLKTFKIVREWIFPFIEDLKYFVYQKILRMRLPSLEERFNFSLSLMDTVLALSSTPYGMFQSCDSHLGNFGLSVNSEVKIIDGDQVLPIHYLQLVLTSKKCINDRNCRVGDFYECSSECDQSTGFCTSELEKRNIQNICSDSLALIFRNISEDFKNQTLICLEKAIYKLAAFCYTLPTEKLVSEIKDDIEIVKEKLLHISRGEFDSCL
ncbi:divergent protein kinase domain 1A-like isoform X2 [Actinia tenebrosa]|nr:divergent protein kinase domain 1A-like isoform X2 [Actinia tenebrosa]